MARKSTTGKKKPQASMTGSTRRKQRDEALRGQEQFFQSLIENALDVIMIINGDGIISYVSPSVERVSGYKPMDLIGERAFDFVHPEDLANATDLFTQMTQNEEAAQKIGVTVRARRKDGSWRFFEAIGHNLLDDPEIGGIVINYRDVNERKQAEEALKESEDRYHSVFHNAQDGIVLIAFDTGNILDCNTEFERQTGRKLEQLKRLMIWDIRPPEMVEVAREKFFEIRERGMGESAELDFCKPNGEIVPIEFKSVVVEIRGRQYLQSMCRDITERKQAEEALREKHERLLKAQRVARMGFLDWNLKTDEMYWSDEVYDLYGIDPEKEKSSIERTMLLVHPDDQQFVKENLDMAIKGVKPYDIDHRKLRPDGKVIWVHAQAELVRDEDGNPESLLGTVVDITERKQAEEALTEERDYLEKLHESIGEPIFTVKLPERVIEHVNRLVKATFGYEPEECIGRNTEMFYAADERYLEFGQELKGALERGQNIMSTEQLLKRKNGEIFPAEITTSFLRGEGKGTKVISIIKDITERKLAEEMLRGSEEKYRGIFDESVAAIYVFDAKKNFIDSNQSGLALMGYSREELLSMSIPDVDADPVAVLPAHAQLLSGENIVNYEHRLKCKDGRIITVLNNSRPLTDVQGNVVGMQSTLIDITERKQAQKALQESEQKYRELYENAPVMLYTLDDKGVLLDCNKAFSEVIGRSKEEMIGKPVSGFETQASGRLAAEAQERLLREGSLKGERDFINREGNIATIEYDAHTEYDEGLQGIVIKAAAKDITERKLAEVELTRYRYHLEERVAERTADLRNANARLREEINESKRMDEKMQALCDQEKTLRQNLEAEMKKRVEFTRALAHELKTPLTPVVMSSQALVSQLKEEPLASLAKNVSRGASNLNDRIDELLDLAKGEIGMLQLKAGSVDMRPLLEEAINDVATLASSRGQSLVSELPPTLPKVRADEVRSRQVVMNLLNNALKFTPEGGKITLRAREEDAGVTVEVQDTGPGITRKEQKQIFVPYHPRKADTEHQSGLGLGLALCKTLVELHGGQIWVKSRPGKGSTFGFSLPLEAAK